MNFSKFARQYAWMADNRLWGASIQEVAKQLPPSSSQLTLVDLSCGPGHTLRELVALRPDILPIGVDLAWGMVQLAKDTTPTLPVQGDAFQLPLASNSIDALILQRTYYFLPHKATLLAEALRVLRPGGRLVMIDPMQGRHPLGAWKALSHGGRAIVDMFAWHLAAQKVGGFSPESIAVDLQAAGFARILAEPVLKGFGVLSRGEKPYPDGTSTLERVAVGAADSLQDNSQILRGEQLLHTQGKFIHLLIQQLPNKPVWKLQTLMKNSNGKRQALAKMNRPSSPWASHHCPKRLNLCRAQSWRVQSATSTRLANSASRQRVGGVFPFG